MTSEELFSTGSLVLPALAVVRHGQTDWNAERRFQGSADVELNATGREQAHQAAIKLREAQEDSGTAGWDLVITSPQARAQETARIIATELELDEPVVVEGLRERAYGPYDGKLYSELSEDTFVYLFPGHRSDAEQVEARGRELGILDGVESSHHAGERGAQALAYVGREYPQQRIIAVSHGSTSRCMLNALDGWERINPGLKNAEVRYLSPEQLERLTALVNA